MSDKPEFHASALKKFLTCERSYYYRYVQGVEDESGDAAKLGTAVHKEMERYFLGEKPERELHPLAQELLSLSNYPAPRAPGLKVEHRFSFTYEGVSYGGTMDLALFPQIWDWKTSSNPRKWGIAGTGADSPETLLDDLQAALYIYYATTQSRGRAVTATWVYVATKGDPLPYKVEQVNVTREEAEAAFRRLVYSPAMLLSKKGSDETDYDINEGPACRAFGGCSYKDRCPAWSKLALRTRFDSGTSGRVADLSWKKETSVFTITGKHLLERLERDGPMVLSTSKKPATVRRPFMPLNELKLLEQKQLVRYSDAPDDMRHVWLLSQAPPASGGGYTHAADVPVGDPKTVESVALSKAMTTGKKNVTADLHATQKEALSPLILALGGLLDYGLTQGVDLLAEWEKRK